MDFAKDVLAGNFAWQEIEQPASSEFPYTAAALV
jgi:hypothetical protein